METQSKTSMVLLKELSPEFAKNQMEGKANAWNYQSDGNAYICGIHFSPVKEISVSLSYQGWKPVDVVLSYKNSLLFSFEHKLYHV